MMPGHYGHSKPKKKGMSNKTAKKKPIKKK